MEGVGAGEKLQIDYYRFIRNRNEPTWNGIKIVKFPSDLILYSQVIQKRRPTWIVETGTAYGGSSQFFADMLYLNNSPGGVISIDVKLDDVKPYRGVTYIKGSSTEPSVVKKVIELVKQDSVMVVLDSNHSTNHVWDELQIYSKIVSKRQYIVVEDCWTRHSTPYKPYYAVRRFLRSRDDFRRFNLEKQFLFCVTRDGWLRRLR